MRRAAARLLPEELPAAKRGRLVDKAKDIIARLKATGKLHKLVFYMNQGALWRYPEAGEGVVSVDGIVGEPYDNIAAIHIEYTGSGKPLDGLGVRRLVEDKVVSFSFLDVHVGADAMAASKFQEDQGIRLLADAGARLLNCIHSGSGSEQPWLSRAPRATAVTMINPKKLHDAGFRIKRKRRVTAGGRFAVWGSEELV